MANIELIAAALLTLSEEQESDGLRLSADIQDLEDKCIQNITDIGIRIFEIKKVIYTPTLTDINVLIPAKEIKDTYEKDLLYIESGSQHGMLTLIDITKDPYNRYQLPAFRDEKENLIPAFYERGHMRNIMKIWLKEDDVLNVAFHGTFEDLLKHPNIKPYQC